MVTWQLQHNREQHELRVRRLRNFIALETGIDSIDNNCPRNIPQINSRGEYSSSGSWIDRINVLVASEKMKLLKQTEAVKQRIKTAEKELEILCAMNISLQNNQKEWQKRLEAAKGNVQIYQNTVLKAANKVKILMEKLDISFCRF